MKRLTRTLLLFAFVSALIVPLARAQSAASDAKAAHQKEEKSEKKMRANLNSASKEELMEIKGIDDATAEKIIAGRPYASKAELKSKNIVDAKTYKMISGHVWAKKAKESAVKEKKEEGSEKK